MLAFSAMYGLFTTGAVDSSGWELGLAILCTVLVVAGLYWMIAALVGCFPFESWTPAGSQRPLGAAGPSSTSASPIAASAPSPLAIEVQKAKFGRADQRQWVDATKIVKSHVAGGRLDMVASVTEFDKDPAFGFIKTLRIKYRINGGPAHRVEFTENDHVQLP